MNTTKRHMRNSKGYQSSQMKKIEKEFEFHHSKSKAIAIFGTTALIWVMAIYVLRLWGILVGIPFTVYSIAVFLQPWAVHQKSVILECKKLDMTKEEFEKEIEAKGIAKQLMVGMWDKVPEPEVKYPKKGRPRGVNQSKQNKKKRKYK